MPGTHLHLVTSASSPATLLGHTTHWTPIATENGTLGNDNDGEYTGDTEDYINSGFLTLQMLVDKYIIFQRNDAFDVDLAQGTQRAPKPDEVREDVWVRSVESKSFKCHSLFDKPCDF